MTTKKQALLLLYLLIPSLCKAMNEEQKAEYHDIRQMYENRGKPKTAQFKDKLLIVKIARDASGTETTKIFARLKNLQTTITDSPLDEDYQDFVNQMQQAMGLNTYQIRIGSTTITQEHTEQLIQTIVKSADGNETITNH